MTATKRAGLRVPAFGFLVFVAGLTSSTCINPPGPLDRISVRMKWVYNGTVSEFFYGKRQGIFRQHQLDVELQPGGPGISGVTLVESEKSTFAVTSAEEVIRARSKGIAVKAIASVFQRNPVVFLADASAGISSPRDLPGKTVALVRGDNTELQYYQMLAMARVDPKSVTEKPWTFDLRQFAEGPIDLIPAYAFDQPVTLALEAPAFKFRVLNPQEHQVNATGDVLITSDKVLQERPEMVIRFVNAFIEAMSEARAKPSEAVSALLLETRSGLDRAKEMRTWEIAKDFVLNDPASAVGDLPRDKWVATRERLIAHGGLEAKTAASIDDCLATHIIEQARLLHLRH